jgi:multidrug efflux pump subunit AcrA (membrane-fusion protein)
VKIMKNWWKTRTALVSGGIAIVVLSAACVQLAPMARTRFATGSEVSDAAQTARNASATAPNASGRVVRRPAATGPRTAVVTRGPIAETTSISGRVAGTDEMPLGFAAGIRLQNVLVRVGDSVEPGQVLAEADAREILKELTAARAQLETATVRLAQSQAQAGYPLQDAAQRAQLAQAGNQRSVIEAEGALRRAQADL